MYKPDIRKVAPDNMNLVAELVRVGVPPRNVTQTIADAIRVSRKTAENKLKGITAWTLPEAFMLNETFFSGKQNLEYLFGRETNENNAVS